MVYSTTKMDERCSKVVHLFEDRLPKMAQRYEIINYTIQVIAQLPLFLSGSRAEFIQGLDSDTDLIYESQTITATTGVGQANHLTSQRQVRPTSTDAVVVMDTYGTHPGYTKVKLFDVNRYQSEMMIDVRSLCVDGTDYISSMKTSQYWKQQITKGLIFPSQGMSQQFQSHGPCITFQYGGVERVYDIDTLFSLHCDWPEIANDWRTRHRNFNWPDEKTLAMADTLGCSLVPVGHAYSSEKELEWRISFNKLERQLVWSFNTTQYACIDIMKIFFNMRISSKFPDAFPSYFIKTTMFWMVEESPVELWKPENLSQCLEELLNRIITCLKRKEVRNYFIPSNNMMDTRLTFDLDGLLLELMTFKTLEPTKWDEVLHVRTNDVAENDVYVHHVLSNGLCLARHISMNLLSTSDADIFSRCLRHIREKIPQAIDQDLSKDIFLILQKEFETIHAIHNLQQKGIGSGEDALELLLEQQADFTFCSGRLMLASFHLNQGRIKKAQDIAEDVISSYDETTVHYTFHNRDRNPKDEDYHETYRSKTSTFQQTLKRFIAFDVVCLPVLIPFYPEAVREVMRKSKNVLFINPLFYTHVIKLHCCLASGNLNKASEVANNLKAFVEENSPKLNQSSDISIYHITAECLKLIGRFREADEYTDFNIKGRKRSRNEDKSSGNAASENTAKASRTDAPPVTLK